MLLIEGASIFWTVSIRLLRPSVVCSSGCLYFVAPPEVAAEPPAPAEVVADGACSFEDGRVEDAGTDGFRIDLAGGGGSTFSPADDFSTFAVVFDTGTSTLLRYCFRFPCLFFPIFWAGRVLGLCE